MAVKVTYKHEANPIEEVIATCEEHALDIVDIAEAHTEGWIIISARERNGHPQSVFLSYDNAEAFFKEGLRFVAQLRAG